MTPTLIGNLTKETIMATTVQPQPTVADKIEWLRQDAVDYASMKLRANLEQLVLLKVPFADVLGEFAQVHANLNCPEHGPDQVEKVDLDERWNQLYDAAFDFALDDFEGAALRLKELSMEPIDIRFNISSVSSRIARRGWSFLTRSSGDK
jgi:hypothetical protein